MASREFAREFKQVDSSSYALIAEKDTGGLDFYFVDRKGIVHRYPMQAHTARGILWALLVWWVRFDRFGLQSWLARLRIAHGLRKAAVNDGRPKATPGVAWPKR